MFKLAPAYATRKRGITNTKRIQEVTERATGLVQKDFALDSDAENSYELYFALAYLDSHIAAGLITEHQKDDIMDYLCDHDVIEI